MSGGSMNYLYRRVEDAADNIETGRDYDLYDDYTPRPVDPKRLAFAAHLRLVAKALHDIEWVDSGDCVPGDEHDAIDACLNGGTT